MSLTKKQSQAIDDLFESGGDEAAVLTKHNIRRKDWQKWQGDNDFKNEITARLESAKRRSRIILAKYLPVAAAKLVHLCGSDKEETARRACLDILELRNKIAAEANADENEDAQESAEQIDPATASKLLAALADE
ncbi:MAG: hypothetical protein PHP01_05940 [Phycisphaerae bacterium]|nr:hypothetical protein [Phycisphaerae bacterium]